MTNAEKNIPLVTVLMPVYNSSAYVRSAIESILSQTFKDFELLIINDGSSDGSAEIIASFKDPRIKVLDNGKNIGLIASLNRGIDIAQGKYIARMDADDISLSTRLEKQVNYLEAHPEVAVLAARAATVNANGIITGEWKDDAKYISESQIRNYMAFSNCIVHPSIMAKASLLKKYKYKEYQQGAEDWDLWLRILSDGNAIHKLDEVLLHYRVHMQSIMASEKAQKSVQQRLIAVKRKFLIHQCPKFNGYFFLVKYSLLRSIASHFKYNLIPQLLRSLKRIITSSPITVISQKNALRKTLNEYKPTIIFFFPYTHIGGAEQVHADIARAFKDQKPLVIFTGFSQNENFLFKYTPHARTLNIPYALNYPFLYKKSQKELSDYINNQTKITVFGSNSGYFYELCRVISANARIIDLIHAFKYQPEGNLVQKKYLAISQKFANRVFISSAALEEFKTFCFHQNCPDTYMQKLVLINNCTNIPAEEEKSRSEKLNVLFVGRNSEEKRAYLFEEIATQLHSQFPDKFTFTMIGNKGRSHFIKYIGEITDGNEMARHYKDADVLVLTSYREGFPMVIMEAMAHGTVPVATPVGDIPKHVTSTTGILTSSPEEKIVVKEICEKLIWLKEHPEELERLSENAYAYAKLNFSEDRFKQAYRKLFNV